MPPMLCLSPVILDQSFPENQVVLAQVVDALGELQDLREKEKVVIVATAIFPLFLEECAWDKVIQFPLLMDVSRYLTALFLQPNSSLYIADINGVSTSLPHPVPIDCPITPLVTVWADEVGKLLVLHDMARGTEGDFIGIACHQGFSTGSSIGYPEGSAKHLSLVGLSTYASLADCRTYITAPIVSGIPLSFASAKKNVEILGGVVTKSAGGSHSTVHFPGAARPWVISRNEDPVKDAFVKQLVPLLNKPFEYVKHALLVGEIPISIFKLDMV